MQRMLVAAARVVVAALTSVTHDYVVVRTEDRTESLPAYLVRRLLTQLVAWLELIVELLPFLDEKVARRASGDLLALRDWLAMQGAPA